jgi:outer membrane cobalamin receptor
MAYLKSIDFLDIQANLRNDSTSLFGKETTYLLGAKYNQTEKLSYYFNKSTAFITPNTYAISTNASVLPEQHDQYELGLTFFDDLTFFRVGYFDTDTKNPITYDPEDSYKAKNFSLMQNQGMEIQGKIYRGNHTFDYSLTFQNPRTPSGLNPKVMTQSARRSKFYGSFGYALTMNKYTFSLRATVSGKRRDSDYNNIDLEKYLSVNGTLNYQFLPQVNVFASVQNISNSRHQLAYGYNTIPRLFMMGFKVNY